MASQDVEARLAWYLKRNGQVRSQDGERFKTEGWQKYKKGAEIRLTALSEDELAEIRALLEQAGFKLARPFRKTRYRYVQPIYGKAEVARFLAFGQPQPSEASE
ncbi:MAG: hypothetical protein Fur0022_15750 [Anaerolineales bacterium]